jgi:tetratricopeptide (TPR) repeat protein
MRAHWHIRRFTREDMAEARRLLEQATAIDSANAMALGDLSFANHFAACFGWVDDVPQGYARAGEAARRAVAIDDGDAHAHSALAIYDLFQGGHEEARRRLRRALELDPNSAFAHGYLGCSYGFAGDYETALPLLDQAIRLSPRDPLLVIWHLCKGWAALLSERYEEAIEFTTVAAEANSEFPDVHAVLAAAHGLLGNARFAGQSLAEFLRRIPVLTADDERLNRPFGNDVQRELFLDGLRKAGLPEKQ